MSKRPWSVWRAPACAAIFLLLAAAPALAQEGEVSPADTPIGWVFRWLNFALVFGAIAYAVWKYGAPYFRQHAEEISRQIAEGARAREAAERQRREIKTKLEGLEREIEQLRVDAKRDAEAEAQRLRDMGRAEAEKIELAARAEIEAAGRAARIELKVLGARLAIERAELLLRQELAPKSEATLIRT
ncbi:MAG: ATP synthase F0 subunit B, partial [Candidatus Acidiferrales bacterium]